MNSVVEVRNLTKSYGKVVAVDNVSFTLEADKIYGLLGRNGAGKTTIMHMITAQQFATSGDIKVFGEAPYENNRVLSQMCFIKESQKYPDTFRVIDVLEVCATLYANWDWDFAKSLIEDFRLPIKRRMKKLSRGMLSSVGIIVGLASRAPFTIFDEPYIGLDAVARTIFYNRLIEDFSLHPRTVLLSTHLIDEVSGILEHIMLIDNGKLMLNVDADDLRGQAFTIVGRASAVDSFTKGMQVIARDTFGSLASVTVMGEMNADNRGIAQSLGLELAPVPLQQLIVHLTSQHADRKENKVI